MRDVIEKALVAIVVGAVCVAFAPIGIVAWFYETIIASLRPSCDRETLLALADEMDDLAGAWGGKYPTNRVAAYARCIREALGVTCGGV